VTITRRRPDLLWKRCIGSVKAQIHKANHLVVIDDCEATAATFANHRTAGLNSVFMPRSEADRTGPGRSSRLRNWAVRATVSEWIAFLDDDNEWEPLHLRTLLDTARISGVDAAHSERIVLLPSGEPWLDDVWPWSSSDEEGRKIYAQMAALGVVSRGEPFIRDRADEIGCPEPYRGVDTNAWLFKRDLLLTHPWAEAYSREHEDALAGEDDVLLAGLVESGVRVASSRKATLRYFLGGYSNNRARAQDPTFRWR
jgi:glycosyltransferase involved in cell wall biosynthesis